MTTNKALISRSVIDRIIRCNAIAGRAAWIQNDRPKAPAGYHEDICETCDFAGYVRKRFTPASGWIPVFSADVRRWGPVTTWNAAQLGVLLDFICPDRRLTEYGLGDRLTEEIDTLASAALSKRITAYCCEDAA